MNTDRHLPQSLFSRLSLFLLGAFFILHTVTILTVADFFERHMVQNMLGTHSATIALCVRMFEAEPAQSRPALMAGLTRFSDVRVKMLDKKPDMPQGTDMLSRFFLEHIREALDDLAEPGQQPRVMQAQVRVIILGKEAGQWATLFERFFSFVTNSISSLFFSLI